MRTYRLLFAATLTPSAVAWTTSPTGPLGRPLATLARSRTSTAPLFSTSTSTTEETKATAAAALEEATTKMPRSRRPSLRPPKKTKSKKSKSKKSTASKSSEKASKSTELELEPAYVAALEMAQAKLGAVLPEEYHGQMLPLLSHFVGEYLKASQTALEAGSADDVVGPEAAASRILQGIMYGLQYGTGPDKFSFDVTHKALRGQQPDQEDGNDIDFYEFGCAFFRPYMDFGATKTNGGSSSSSLMGADNLAQAEAQLEAGENVVFFANHQSEADPQVVSCCLERAGSKAADLAERMVYVAGHKVTTDALAIPFSMGRNLLCIHSKKHISADPTTKANKQQQNLRSMSELLNKFKAGGAAVWVAPSGGRDRRDLKTGEVPLAPFDSKTIDIFRLMGKKSKVLTHYYTLAMVSYDLCPPPDFVEAGVGEERNIRFSKVGIAVGDELENRGGLEARHLFCDRAFDQCDADYHALLAELGKE